VSKKTAVMEWIDDRLKADPRLAREVDEILSEIRLEQDLAALREKRKLTQRQVAELLGTSQPYVAKGPHSPSVLGGPSSRAAAKPTARIPGRRGT
jgi:DNA-binding transcriptional regulator YiaG